MLSAEQLQMLRIRNNITQKELAEEIGLKNKNYISMIEHRKEGYSQEWHDNFVNSIYKILQKRIEADTKAKAELEQAKDIKIQATEDTQQAKK